jgi:hypothetical protein
MTSKSKLWSFIFILLSGVILSFPFAGFAQTPIDCGQTLAGSISTPGEIDQYNFTGAVNDVVSLRAIKTAGDSYFNPRMDNRLIQVIYEDGRRVTYTYDESGNRMTLTNE